MLQGERNIKPFREEEAGENEPPGQSSWAGQLEEWRDSVYAAAEVLRVPAGEERLRQLEEINKEMKNIKMGRIESQQ